MREVDDALSHAYSRRAASGGSGLPGPHWAARPQAAGAGPAPFPSSRPFDAPGEALPSVEQEARWLATDPGGDDLAPNVSLQWPELVLTLEREWAERFERMADRLIETRDRQRLKVLLFTSCHRAEGRTTLVLTLARFLARRPGRTLLVDADLTGPMLSRSLGLRPESGLEDVVEEGHALGDALLEAPDDHLWLLPLRGPVARPRDFLASPGWACLMARLRREFDLVLVDGSPMFTGLSAAVLHRSVDAAVLVHNSNLTGERSLLRAREVLDGGGIPLLGLAETFV